MPYYHATFQNRIDSIKSKGLGGVKSRELKNFKDCDNGVYLAKEPEIAFYFMLELYHDGKIKDLTPREALEAFRVIVVDDSRLDHSKLRVDDNPGAGHHGCFIYDGEIDIHAMPIIGHELIFRD